MPSAAKSRRLPEPFVFFIDRSLGSRALVESLRAGCSSLETVHAHDDFFPQDATDVEWLTEVGARGWVVLTKDSRILTNAIERDALLASEVAFFTLGRGDISAPRMGETFCLALDRIRTVLRRYPVPIVATVTASATVTVRIAGGDDLRPPKNYPPPRSKGRPG
jgi:predicted nuclease of predicted toxin-antitoxin system